MEVFGKKILKEFCKTYTDAESQINSWLFELMRAQWQSPQEIKKRYITASILPNNGVVFNIKGNKYRIFVVVDYKNKMVMIKNIGTHADYEKWNL
jgi:mRNA interferase HigB